jgi:hypothetical protein
MEGTPRVYAPVRAGRRQTAVSGRSMTGEGSTLCPPRRASPRRGDEASVGRSGLRSPCDCRAAIAHHPDRHDFPGSGSCEVAVEALPVFRDLKRAMGFEPTTLSLGS